MGSCLSCLPCCDGGVPAGLKQIMEEEEETFRFLALDTADVVKLWRIFFTIDSDANGSVTTLEFLMYCDLERTLFAERAFQIFDEDKSGLVDFREFIMSVWNYCTFDRTALILFAFDLYDLDGSGKIDAKEMKRILREVYGVGPGKDDLIEREARKIEGMAAPGVSARGEHQTIGGFITQAHFKDFVDRHPTILFPVFSMQRRLQEKLGGVSFWQRMTARRQLRARREQHLDYRQWKNLARTLTSKSKSRARMGVSFGLSSPGGSPPGRGSIDDIKDAKSVASEIDIPAGTGGGSGMAGRRGSRGAGTGGGRGSAGGGGGGGDEGDSDGRAPGLSMVRSYKERDDVAGVPAVAAGSDHRRSSGRMGERRSMNGFDDPRGGMSTSDGAPGSARRDEMDDASIIATGMERRASRAGRPSGAAPSGGSSMGTDNNRTRRMSQATRRASGGGAMPGSLMAAAAAAATAEFDAGRKLASPNRVSPGSDVGITFDDGAALAPGPEGDRSRRVSNSMRPDEATVRASDSVGGGYLEGASSTTARTRRPSLSARPSGFSTAPLGSSPVPVEGSSRERRPSLSARRGPGY